MSQFENNLSQILIAICQYEQKMQTYRQLLNQQIQFNLKDLYILVSGNSAQVTAFHLHVFVNQQVKQDNEISIKQFESIIKGYNNCTSMNLSFIQFALIFLSRQNKLLSKLALQRNSLGEIPTYLLNYAKKILQLQGQLHQRLEQFKAKNSIAAEQWLKKNSLINQDTGLDEFDEHKLIQICKQLEIQFEIISRYLRTNQKQPINIKKMQALFTLKNYEKLTQFFKAVQKNKNKLNIKDYPDPFIRPEFHDCLERPKILQNFSYRQIKSIEKHLQRLNSKSKNQLSLKINNYRNFIQKQLKIAGQAINDIIWLQKQIQTQRIQLCLCTDFYPILFFDTFNKDRQTYLIPSSLQNYLERLGLKIELNNIYVIFKRFSIRADGKLTFAQFCSIFDVCNVQYTHIQKNRQVKSLEDVEIETIKHFLKLIKILTKNQLKIEKIKTKLQNDVDLRQIFSVFDADEDGYVSMLDFKVVWKKFLLLDLKDEDLMLFWHRMKQAKEPNLMLKYQKFISQLTPKSTWIQKSKKVKNKDRTIR